MLESRHDMINGGQVLDTFLAVTESVTLEVYEQTVECVTGAAVDVTVTLPNVCEAKGKIYTIVLVTDGGFDVVIQDQDESKNWTDLTLDTVLDYAVLYSDGRKWWTLASEVV